MIGTYKLGNILAVDAQKGEESWWHTLGTTYRTWAEPTPQGSGEVCLELNMVLRHILLQYITTIRHILQQAAWILNNLLMNWQAM